MGYNIELTASQFRIPAARTAGALAAVLALFSPDDITLATGGTTVCGANGTVTDRWFAFVNPVLMERAAERRNLAFALDAFRFVPTQTAAGDIVSVRFRGERAGDERFLFAALGPYVEPGSFIEMTGEDGAVWRWTFEGEACTLHVLVPSEWGPSWLVSAGAGASGRPSHEDDSCDLWRAPD